MKLKICLVTVSLANGGAEMSTAMMSKMLHRLGNEVYLVSLTNDIVYDYEGELLNLGLKKTDKDGLFVKVKRFYFFRKYLKQHRFDFVIDNRSHQTAFRELFYMYFLYRGLKFIYVIRSSKLSLYFPASRLVSKLMLKKATITVAVSQFIQKCILSQYSSSKLTTIYNAIDPKAIEESTSSACDYALFMGRLEDDVKNISLLLDAYTKSELAGKLPLRIVGDGADELKIKSRIDELGLHKDISIFPFNVNKDKILKDAKFLVLTSHFEGFPRVLIEALAMGVPVVSVDCVSGPSEIVKNEVNGLLVENYNVEALAMAMYRMHGDNELYLKCAKNAKNSVSHLSMDIIAKQWNQLLIGMLKK